MKKLIEGFKIAMESINNAIFDIPVISKEGLKQLNQENRNCEKLNKPRNNDSKC